MAQVNIELSHDSNDFELGIHKKCDELFEEFEKKWKSILERFEGQFLNNGYVIADPNGIEVSTSSFPTVDDGTPNFDRAVCKFFENSKEWTGDAFGTGQEGYPDEFYNDLYELCTFYSNIHYSKNKLGYDDPIPTEISELIKKEIEDKCELDFFCGNANVIGYEGYYSLMVSLRPDGLSISSELYEEQEDEEEKDVMQCDICGEGYDFDSYCECTENQFSKAKVEEAIINTNDNMEEAAKYLGLEMENFSIVAKKHKLFKTDMVQDSEFQEDIEEIRKVVKRIIDEEVEYNNWVDFIKENGFENVDHKIGVIEIKQDKFLFRICNKSLDEVPDKINIAEGFLVGWLVKD
jgi:hypothetical protein